jgi:hypothetical protein
VKEAAMLDKPALMKKLRGLLGDLSGRVAGRNKDDINDALIAVCFSTLDPQSPIPNPQSQFQNNFQQFPPLRLCSQRRSGSHMLAEIARSCEG